MYSMAEVKKNQLGLDFQEIYVEEDYQNYKKADPFDISSLRLFRPTFFSFMEESVNSDIYNYRTKGGSSVSRTFIQVMRSVMNSKVNEFIYGDCPEKFTRFPEYVYSWFQKFYFNSEKNTVSILEPYMVHLL